jgi:hypothetical protein
MSDDSQEPKGFHYYYRGVAPLKMPFTEAAFMVIVTFALVVALPAAIAGIFWGMAQLGGTWGGGH